MPTLNLHRVRTFCGDLSFRLEIALVTHNDHWKVVLIFDAQYLLLECDDLFERLPLGYGVDKQETFTGPHVLLSHCRVFLLTCGIEHIEECDFVIDNTLLAIRVCRWSGQYRTGRVVIHSIGYTDLRLWDRIHPQSGSG